MWFAYLLIFLIAAIVAGALVSIGVLLLAAAAGIALAVIVVDLIKRGVRAICAQQGRR